MRAQFGRCSFSKIDFLPPSGFDQFDNGVLNIQLNYRLRGRGALGVMNDAVELVAEVLGVDFLGRTFDHVIICIARGTIHGGRSEWSAFAALNGWWSVFNSGRCDSLTYLMHEIGHNLGLVHSAADIIDDPYGNTTGVVSCSSLLSLSLGSHLSTVHCDSLVLPWLLSLWFLVSVHRWDTGECKLSQRSSIQLSATAHCFLALCHSEPRADGPLKCFNPSKNWRLGWYTDKTRHIGLGGSWHGSLVAFVDYDLADPNNNRDVVLLRLGDFLYLQYNRAKKFNAGTSQHKDKVVAVAGKGGLTSSASVLRAGIGARESYSWKGTTIQVCSLNFNSSSTMDYAEVAVYPTGTVSMCTFAPTESPSAGPSTSSAPSPRPSSGPTISLFSDSPAPTPSPTDSLTILLPSVSPTASPTSSPASEAPTTPTTDSPTNGEPTPPSLLPTPKPSTLPPSFQPSGSTSPPSSSPITIAPTVVVSLAPSPSNACNVCGIEGFAVTLPDAVLVVAGAQISCERAGLEGRLSVCQFASQLTYPCGCEALTLSPTTGTVSAPSSSIPSSAAPIGALDVLQPSNAPTGVPATRRHRTRHSRTDGT